MSEPIQKYSLPLRALHWIMALLILSVLALGLWMTGLEKEDPLRMESYGLHKSLGVSVLLLAFLRLTVRLTTSAPKLPHTIPSWQGHAAHSVHYALYLLMFLIPLSGYIMSNSFGYPVHLFSLQLPFLVAENKEIGKIAAEAHELLAYSMTGLLALHIGGVIQHRFLDKTRVNLIKRMV